MRRGRGVPSGHPVIYAWTALSYIREMAYQHLEKCRHRLGEPRSMQRHPIREFFQPCRAQRLRHPFLSSLNFANIVQNISLLPFGCLANVMWS